MFILALVLGGVPIPSPAAEAPLTSLRAVTSLSNEQAERHLPVSFEATVTYFRSYEHTLFVQDGDRGMYIYATTDLQLVPGDRILVRGTTGGSFRPIVSSSDLSMLRRGSPPRPERAGFESMIQGQLDCRYVLVQGRVRAANLSLSSGIPVTHLEVQTPGGIVRATMDSPDPAPLKGLVDAEVQITGVVSGQFDGKMQMVGLLIHSTSLADLRILHTAPADPWALPVTAFDHVLNESKVDDRSGHVRVIGTLTYYRQTSMAILQDGNRSIRVETPQVERLRLGDRVEAIGIPAVEDDFLTLKLGQIRSLGAAPAIVPPLLAWDEIASGKYAFNLVSIEGTVVSQVREQSQDSYSISSGNHLFTANVRHPYVYEWNVRRDLPPMPRIRPGSKVRLTGVALLESGNPYNGPTSFVILLRGFNDVVVVAGPPLLDVRNLLIVAGLLVALMFVVVGRALSLERRVRREAALTAIVESRRSEVLEDINRARPLAEIVGKITSLLSYKLGGAPCWCELRDGTLLGNKPSQPQSPHLEIIQQTIPSHAGKELGTITALIDARTKGRGTGSDALFNATQLAALAIETGGLYSDLVRRSEFDLLTDVHNRFSLEKKLDRLIESERREDDSFGLIYIDLDDFKLVNDQYGHRTGDLYLQEAASRMNRQLRPGDMFARLGGDEFAAVVSMIRSRADVVVIARRLERCFAQPFELEGCSIRGTVSMGIALYPEDGCTRDSLLSAADAAMYVAKNTRRNAAETAAGSRS